MNNNFAMYKIIGQIRDLVSTIQIHNKIYMLLQFSKAFKTDSTQNCWHDEDCQIYHL